MFKCSFLGLLSGIALAQAGGTPVLSIGHRGNDLFAPENTVASFTAAQGKADLIEFDVQVTADGKLVIMHDSTVDRTTDGTGSIATNTLAKLKLLDAGSWFSATFKGERIPTLEEGLNAILPGATPLIEQKTGSAASIVAELRRLNTLTNIVLQSFDWAFLSSAHALEPSIPLCGLGSGTLSSASITSISNTGARTVAWEKAGVTANTVALVHAAGLRLFVWTVDGPEIQNYLDLGVDGVISNDPGMVKSLQTPTTNGPVSLGDRLVSYWRLDDGLSASMVATAVDSKGTNTGTLLRPDGQSHWLGAGGARFGGAVQLQGTNGCVTFPKTASLDIGTNEVSLSLWVKLREFPSQNVDSFGGIFDSVEDSYVIYLDKSAQELRFKVTASNGDAARPGIPQAYLVTNQWLHVAATYSGKASPASGQTVIYLNGVARDVHTGSDSSGAGLTGNVKTGQGAALGRNGTQVANSFYGAVDDVAVWKRALGIEEIRQLYQQGQQGLSLGDLLRQPTSLLEPLTVRQSGVNQWQIVFRSLGSWQTFTLLRASDLAGPFLRVAGLNPVSLGGGIFRFDYTSDPKSWEYFRIEAQ